jgi:hypothetical protein
MHHSAGVPVCGQYLAPCPRRNFRKPEGRWGSEHKTFSSSHLAQVSLWSLHGTPPFLPWGWVVFPKTWSGILGRFLERILPSSDGGCFGARHQEGSACRTVCRIVRFSTYASRALLDIAWLSMDGCSISPKPFWR